MKVTDSTYWVNSVVSVMKTVAVMLIFLRSDRGSFFEIMFLFFKHLMFNRMFNAVHSFTLITQYFKACNKPFFGQKRFLPTEHVPNLRGLNSCHVVARSTTPIDQKAITEMDYLVPDALSSSMWIW